MSSSFSMVLSANGSAAKGAPGIHHIFLSVRIPLMHSTGPGKQSLEGLPLGRVAEAIAEHIISAFRELKEA